MFLVQWNHDMIYKMQEDNFFIDRCVKILLLASLMVDQEKREIFPDLCETGMLVMKKNSFHKPTDKLRVIYRCYLLHSQSSF